MIYVLRLVHILSGAFWYGTLMFIARFLLPSLRAAGPAAGPVMAQLNQRKLPSAMMGAGILNVASGIWLMFIASGGDTGAWMRSGTGQTLGIGGGLALLALIIAMIVNPRAAKRLGEIAGVAAKRAGPQPPEEAAEVARLQKRMALGTAIAATLLTLAVAAMAVARYL